MDIAYYNLCRLVYDLLYVLLYIAPAITILLMSIGAIKLIGAADDVDSSVAAKSMIRNAFIGLVCVLLLVGVSDILIPPCAPFPGEAYSPPPRAVETPPPVVTIMKPKSMEFYGVDTEVEYNFSIIQGDAKSPGSTPYHYVLDYGDGTPTVDGEVPNKGSFEVPSYQYHKYATQGTYTVTVFVTDGEGREAWDKVRILVDNMRVKIKNPLNGAYITSGTSILFDSEIIGGQSPQYYWILDDDINKPFCNTAYCTYTLSDGQHKITLIARDSSITPPAEASDSIIINVGKQPPQIKEVKSCWGPRLLYGTFDGTILEFTVYAVSSPLSNTKVTVFMTSACTPGIFGGCCPYLWREETMKVFDINNVGLGGTVELDHIFCTQGYLFDITVEADEGTWRFCAICDTGIKQADRDCGNATSALQYCKGADGRVGYASPGSCPRLVQVCCEGSKSCKTVLETEVSKDLGYTCYTSADSGDTYCYYVNYFC